MNKFLLAIFALAVATTVASAAVGIAWTTTYGAYAHDAPNVVDYGTPASEATALLNNNSAIWQLIYAGANNTIDSIENVNPLAGGPNGDYVVGDDVVWGQREIALGGGSGNDAPANTVWDHWMLWQSGDQVYEDLSWSTAGFVYQRVFEGTPGNDTWYYETALMPLNLEYSGSGGPDIFLLDTGSAGFQPDIQIDAVPEPATMSLLGLGALVMAIRRRRS